MRFPSKYLRAWAVACGLLPLLLACGGDEPVQAGSCSPSASTACTCPDGITRGNAACTASGVLGVCTPCSAGPLAGSMATAGSGGMAGTTAGTGTAGVGTAGINGAAGTTTAPLAGAGGSAGTTTAPLAGAGGSANAGAAGGMAGVSGGAGAGGAPAPLSCGPGEMCLMSLLGGVKFCSMDAAAVLPPVCTGAGTACGSNGRGVCLDAASVGFPGMLFCIYTAC